MKEGARGLENERWIHREKDRERERERERRKKQSVRCGENCEDIVPAKDN